jgi:acetylornithine deacetylase/succinyl-diaminopimelate desuccinylase-like protein
MTTNPPTAVEILQNLILFDTTNPPGNERECTLYIRDLLAAAGIESTLPACTPERPNLVARLPGQGTAAPLLLYGHLDVVTTAGQEWQVPPFEGRIQDGYLWGRGALDMKGGLAIMLAALLRARVEGAALPGDVIFAAVTDEEAGGDFGAKFLVQQHADLFQGVRYALGEFGGFNLSMAGVRFYPIMIAEKQICWMKATFRGAGGHGSMPVQGGAMSRLGKALQILDERRLPVHVTPPVKLMIDSLADNLPGLSGRLLRQLTNPALSDLLLNRLGERAYLFAPLLHNTVSPTMLQASDKVNVIPCEVALGLDGRLVPGGTAEQMEAELRAILGPDFDLEILAAEPGPAEPDMGSFGRLADILRQLDPGGIPIPYVLSGVTDARFFSQLGIQTYGFTPLKLPEDFNFVSTVHAANERVPLEALAFGAQAIYLAIQR